MVSTQSQPVYDMTVKEFADLVGVNPKSAYRLLEAGLVNHRKPTGVIQVDRVDAHRYLAERTYLANNPQRRKAA